MSDPYVPPDPWRTNPMRPPPCTACGLVESAFTTRRHICNPTHVMMMRIGLDRTAAIGRAIVDAISGGIPRSIPSQY